MKKSNNPHDGNSVSRYGFEMIFKEDEKYYFQFNDTNGEPLLFSKGYNSEKSCADGIQAAIRAAGIDEQYDLNETKNEKYFFILKSGNNKEIGRSRMFDTVEELKEQMEILKDIDEDVPQYGLMDTSSEMNDEAPEEKTMNTANDETRDEVLEEKEKAAALPVEKTKMPEVADKKPSQPEDVEKMPRYKFSVIYYPDSKIWMIKNDFSGDSTNMKTCDGQQIEDFIKSQLPAEELVALQPPVKSKIPAKQEATAKPQKPATEEVELIIRTQKGELIRGFANVGSLGKVDLIPKISEGAQPMAFDAKVMAKSLGSNQTVMIGAVKNQGIVDGRLEIPIYGANILNKGPYRFSAEISPIGQGEQPSTYYGSQLLMLN